MKNIIILFQACLLSFGLWSQITPQTIKGTLKSDKKEDKELISPEDEKARELFANTKIAYENVTERLRYTGAYINYYGGNASTTNSSIYNLSGGFSLWQTHGLNLSLGSYINAGDLLFPFIAFYEIESQVGSIYKTKSEKGIELNASYFFNTHSSRKVNKTLLIDQVGGKSSNGESVVYVLTADIPVERMFFPGITMAYEQGRKEYFLGNNSNIMLRDPATNEMYNYTGKASTSQDYTNLFIGATGRWAYFTATKADEKKPSYHIESFTIAVKAVVGLQNEFDDVYQATPEPEENKKSYYNNSQLLKFREFAEHNEKSNLGIMADFTMNSNKMAITLYARKLPGLVARQNLDVGVKIGGFISSRKVPKVSL